MSPTTLSEDDSALGLLTRIGNAIEQNGYGPSLREMVGGPGLLGRSQVGYHRDRLKGHGLIAFTPGVPRSIQLTKKGRAEWRHLRASQ